MMCRRRVTQTGTDGGYEGEDEAEDLARVDYTEID